MLQRDHLKDRFGRGRAFRSGDSVQRGAGAPRFPIGTGLGPRLAPGKPAAAEAGNAAAAKAAGWPAKASHAAEHSRRRGAPLEVVLVVGPSALGFRPFSF